MNHMDLKSHKFDDGSIDFAYPRIIAAGNYQKDNLHSFKAIKTEDCEDFMKAMEKETKYLTTGDVWGILPKPSHPILAHIIRLIWSSKNKQKTSLESISNEVHQRYFIVKQINNKLTS